MATIHRQSSFDELISSSGCLSIPNCRLTSPDVSGSSSFSSVGGVDERAQPRVVQGGQMEVLGGSREGAGLQVTLVLPESPSEQLLF
jgi:hypothetical protein